MTASVISERTKKGQLQQQSIFFKNLTFPNTLRSMTIDVEFISNKKIGIMGNCKVSPVNFSFNNAARQFLFTVMSTLLVACSNTSKNISSELNSSQDGSLTTSKIEIPNLKLMDLKDLYNSKPRSEENDLNSKINVHNLDAAQKINEDTSNKNQEPFSVSLDPEKAKDRINAYRKVNNLNPLKLNAELSKAAKDHSTDLSKWDRVSHYGSDGSNTLDRVKRTGYKPKIAAENIATGQDKFDEVLDSWIKSPGFSKNLLSAELKDIGLALVRDPKTEFKSFWVLVLAAPE